MIAVFTCRVGHEQRVPNVSEQDMRLLKAFVAAGLARCETCEKKISKVEEEAT